MKSRMEKYYNSTEHLDKRVSRNEELYKEISKSDINEYHVTSNAKILQNGVNDINIEELKKMLDNKYHNPSQRKSIFIEDVKDNDKEEEIVTKEYDINTILEKAREEKDSNYEEERYKKINNTQYDILKKLNLNNTGKDKEQKNTDDETEENLMTLINTITAKELENSGDVNPLDILADLKGRDNTEVIPALKEEDVNETNDAIDKSFYTTSSNINKDDFDFLEEFKEEKKVSKALFWILIMIAIIALVSGIVIIINKYFDLGLF